MIVWVVGSGIEADVFVESMAFLDYSGGAFFLLARGGPGAAALGGEAGRRGKARGRGTSAGGQLRWVCDWTLGDPRAPFTIWARAKASARMPVTDFPIPGPFGLTLLLDNAYAEVVVSISAGPGGPEPGT